MWWVSVAHALTVTLPYPDATLDHRLAEGTANVPIALTLAGEEGIAGCAVKGANVVVSVRQMRCGGRTVPLALLRPIELQSDGPSCLATVELPLEPLVPGDCSLELVVGAVRAPAFVVHVPAPKLEVKTSPVRIERWGWWGKEPDTITVHLTESSGVTGVAGVQASWIPGATTTGISTGATVSCTQADETPDTFAVKTNTSVPVSCTLGGFEYGKVTGTLRFTGQPLAGPVDVPIEVKTIFTPWAVPAIVGAGLGLSFLFRKRLEPRIARSEAISLALTTLQRIAEMRTNARDPVFADALARILDTLRTAIERTSDAESLTKAEKEAHESVTTAREKSAADLTALLTRWRTVAGAIDLDWRLPPAVATAHALARDAVRALGTQIEAGNTREGQSASARADAAVEDLARDLRAELRRRLQVTEGGPPLVAATAKSLRAAATKALTPTTDALEVPSLVHAAFELEQQLPLAVEATREALLDALAVQALAALDAVKRDLAAPVSREPDLALQALEEVVGPAETKVREEVLRLARAAGDVPQAVSDALQAGRYAEAARLVGPELEGASARWAAVAAAPTPGAPVVPQPRPNAQVVVSASTPAWFAGASLAAAEETRRLRTLYYVFVSAGILCIATVQALPTWVGTPQEWLQLFGWALGLDLGSKILFELAAKVAKTP